MSGYQEVITDPSYAGQIITFTYPHIGNYGINRRRLRVRAAVLPRCDRARDGPPPQQPPGRGVARCDAEPLRCQRNRRHRHAPAHPHPARHRARCPAPSEPPTKRRCVPRRRPSRHRRHRPRRRGDRATPYTRPHRRHRAARDRRLRLRHQAHDRAPPRRARHGRGRSGIDHRRPTCWHASPTACSCRTARATRRWSATRSTRSRELLGEVPVFGICLGHQLLSRALGGDDVQAAVRSSRRQPSGAPRAHRHIEITSQNHNFCVDPASLDGKVE